MDENIYNILLLLLLLLTGRLLIRYTSAYEFYDVFNIPAVADKYYLEMDASPSDQTK